MFYGAATTEAQAPAGKRAFVVGGGNSAGQPAVHLSRYAQQVTILIRSNALAASMSRYLIREIETTPTIDVRYSTEVAGGEEAATGAWNSSDSGAGTPVKAKLSQPTGC